MSLKTQSLLKLRIQLAVDRVTWAPLAFIFFSLMEYWLKYRIKDIEKTRAFYKEITRDPRPLLICSNHLTFIDSLLIIWMFGHPLWYWTHFKKASWNLPNAKYAKSIFFRVSCYIGKCIFVERKGAFSHVNDILDQVIYILNRNEVLTIFPEGRRSLTGRFDTRKLAFGPGKIFTNVKDCRILCVYIRGDKQMASSSFPPKGSVFEPQMRFISPKTEKSGFEGYKDIVSQIGETIKQLEEQHFSL